MGGPFADEGHAAVLASFIEARHAPMMGKAPPALGAEARSVGAHAAAALSTSTAAGAHAAAAAATRSGACPLTLSSSLSATSSLTFHLVLLVGRFLPERSLFLTVTATSAPAITVPAVVEAVFMAQLAAEGERAVEVRAYHDLGIVTVSSEHHIDALPDENV